jgi:hypothetical protein
MAFVTGKYILISHGSQTTAEKYDFPFEFESLSFFIPSSYVLENPIYLNNTIVNISNPTGIASLLCNNKLNMDRISKVPQNGFIKLRQMTFSVSNADKNQGREDFILNAGLYYCHSNKQIEKILDWNDLHNMCKLNSSGKLSFSDILELINIHANSNHINKATTALYFYTCRKSCFEEKKGSFAPIAMPLFGPDKIIGQSGPSIRQKQNVFGTIYSHSVKDSRDRDIIGGMKTHINIPVLNVDERLFYSYNKLNLNAQRFKKKQRNKTKSKINNSKNYYRRKKQNKTYKKRK